MKKCFIIILLSISTPSFGQKLSLNDLIKIISMSWDTYDTYILSKGYEFEDSGENIDNQPTYRGYTYGKITLSGGHYTSARRVVKCLQDLDVGYHTIYIEEYLSFKNQLKAAHFMLTGTKNDYLNEGIINIYENQDYRILLSQDKRRMNDNGEEIEGQRYGVQIRRKKKQ